LLSLQFPFNLLTKSHSEVKERLRWALECLGMEAGEFWKKRVNMEAVRGYL
jgi:hypothetical protein